MTPVIHIQMVSSRSKIDTLREFGHRCFIEIGDDGKPIGYFVERKGDAAQSQRVRAKEPVVTGNQHIVWTGKRGDFRPLSVIERVYQHAIEFAAKPAQRAHLELAIMEQTKCTKHQVTGAISRLLGCKILKVAGG